VVLVTGHFRGAQNAGPIRLPSAEGDIVRHVGVDDGVAGPDAVLHVFRVHQLESLAVFFQQFHQILTGMDNPETDHLVADELRFRLGE
jgi:hypothetical protein